MKTPKEIDILAMVGAIFAFVGSILGSAGVWLCLNLEQLIESGSVTFEGDMGPEFLAWMMTGMGLLCLGLGLFLICLSIRNRRKARRLVEGGRYVWAEIVDIQYDWSARINNKPSLRIMLREDAADFGSREFTAGPFPDIEALRRMGKAKVKVYVDLESDDYFVDMSTARYDM